MVDFSCPNWSYLLGVIHGDGHIAKRSISISVSYKEPGYAELLCELWRTLGFEPKTYRPRSALRVDVHDAALAKVLLQTKCSGRWAIPLEVDIGHYFAGVIDTDGHATKPPKRAVVITLKQSGNLLKLCARLESAGLRCLPVRERVSNFNGLPYDIEEASWTAMDQIEWIGRNVPLRHPRKRARLQEMQSEIAVVRSRIPLWRQVAEWLTKEPRDVDEIMVHFKLTKRQVDSVMDNIKAHRDVEVIPPPRILTKYKVRTAA
jgi:hypothetical protein